MKQIVVLAGSSSKKSINKILSNYAADQLGDVGLIRIDLNDFEMPLFSVDKEQEEGFSENTQRLNAVFDTADGFVISLAEHNGSYAAAFKNVFDWLSRMEPKVWRNKPMLLLSTSPGARGGQSVLEAALSRFPHMGGEVAGHLSFPSFYDNFKDGDINNVELKSALLAEIQKFQSAL